MKASYESSFDATLSSMLDFLELIDAFEVRPPFVAGKTYHSYYTNEEMASVARIIESTSSPHTWHLLTKRYFVF